MSSGRSKKGSRNRQRARNSVHESRKSNGPSGDRSASTVDASAGHDSSKFYACVYLVFFVACLIAYQPALDGSFISDDEHYVLNNVFVHDVSARNLLAILDPTGTPAKLVENYAPVHLFFYMLEWQLFERNTVGYHVVNITMHALASLLMLVSFRRFGIARVPALVGTVFFLLHPANVEAVAWISQLKTPVALSLCLLALNIHPRRPALAAAMFALSLLAKPTAAVGLFVLAATVWQARGRSSDQPVRTGHLGDWGWIGVWVLVLVAFAVAEFWAFNQTAGQAPVLYEDAIVRMRTLCAIALRYLVMTLTSAGLSVFHEPPSADSWFDPWWLASLLVLGGLGWRTWHVWVRGRREAIGWIWAVVSFGPISGVIPLPFPMADRYLYFIMPGLIAAILFAVRDHGDVASAWFSRFVDARVVRNVCLGSLVCLIAVFALRVHARAEVWQTGFTMMADAEENYPQGMAAQTRIARRLALAGDAPGAVRALRAARARGYNRLDHLLSEKGYDGIRSHPEFDALVDELAAEWIERYEKIEEPDQHEYRVMAQAYIVLDDLDTAIRRIEAGVEIDGPITEALKEELAAIRRIKRIRESKLPD